MTNTADQLDLGGALQFADELVEDYGGHIGAVVACLKSALRASEAECERLKMAVTPFAKAAEIWAETQNADEAAVYMDLHADAVEAINTGDVPLVSDPEFTVGDFRRLLSALSRTPAGEARPDAGEQSQ